MNRKYALTLLGALGLAAVVTAIVSASVSSGAAVASQPPFVPIPVAGNVAALHDQANVASPTEVARQPADFHPAHAAVFALGRAGWGWVRDDGSTCVLMVNGAGGCGTTFNEPVLLFIEGVRPDRGASTLTAYGIVPDTVRAVEIVMSTGRRISTAIRSNAFVAELPAGASIIGEEVTLRSGMSFFNPDPLGVS